MRFALFVLTLVLTAVPAFCQQDELHPFVASDLAGRTARYMWKNGSRDMKFRDGGDLEPEKDGAEVSWQVTPAGHLLLLGKDKSILVDFAGYIVCSGLVYADTTFKDEGTWPLVLAFSKQESSFARGSGKQTQQIRLSTDTGGNTTPIAGETVEIASPIASLKTLEIQETDNGMMLGQTSEAVLTVTRGKSSKAVSIRFVTPVGDQMTLSRDEAMRFIHLTYPNWYVDNAEISFEDKYDGHDGGSIGAALGTMVLSVIQGFKIDPDAAMTGDISANGKIRAIGGVAAKLRGAVDSKCKLAAIPAENYDQLMDAVIYSGQSMVTDIQVIGVSDLDDAIATVRTDRDAKLTEAIAMFATVQYSLKQSPKYLTTKDGSDKLAKVLQLAPQHLSAKVLLAVAQGELPKTLSPAASQYYTYLALNPMFDVLQQRQQSTDAHKLPSGVIRSGLADLRKLRPLADPTVRPLIDAGVRFTQAWNDLQQNQGSSQAVETQRQSLLDEMTKENSDPKLMQKMLKEGM